MDIAEKIDRNSWQPIKIDSIKLEELINIHKEVVIVDQYKNQLEELFLLRNPKFRFNKNYKNDLELFINEQYVKDPIAAGNWFYYPWINALIHFLPDELHQEIRTGRNKYLITEEEQETYYSAKIGILGMSVGSHIANTIAMTGGAKNIKLADPDTISGDNLNRIRIGFQNVGVNKAIIVARQIYEINPYALVEIFKDGLSEANIESFLGDLNVLIEEMDNPFLKLRVRELAREKRIPVVMGTDNGDGVIVDIERYDINPNNQILNGLIGNLAAEELKQLSPKDLPRVAARNAGANLAVPRMLESVPEVGRTIYSWPQLGTAANMCGTVVAYLARRIALRASNIKSGRYQVNLDSIFESDYKRKWFSRKLGFFKFIKKMKNN